MAKARKGLLGIIDELTDELEGLQRDVAKKLITTVAIETPKKTGEATGGWQVNINKKATTQTGRLDLTGRETAGIGTAVIFSSKGKKLPDIWVSNLVPHIIDLNNGSSAQAPAKFIERAERTALASIK